MDQAALATALVDVRLGGAPIDVFADEPPLADSVPVGVPSLIPAPRIAGATGESNRRAPAERGRGTGPPEALPRRGGAL